MKMIRYVFLSAILLASLYSRAQLSLHIDPHTLDTLSFPTYILNSNNAVNAPFANIVITNSSNFNLTTDSLFFGYSITHGGLTQVHNSTESDTSGVVFKTQVVPIPAGGAATVRVPFYFNNPFFSVGSSIVVIWPIIKGQTVQVDSASAIFHIITVTGIDEIPDSRLKAYLSGSDLVIKTSESELGELRIYNTMGQVIQAGKISGESTIPMQSYAPGIYMIEIILSDGRRKVTKVMNASQH